MSIFNSGYNKYQTHGLSFIRHIICQYLDTFLKHSSLFWQLLYHIWDHKLLWIDLCHMIYTSEMQFGNCHTKLSPTNSLQVMEDKFWDTKIYMKVYGLTHTTRTVMFQSGVSHMIFNVFCCCVHASNHIQGTVESPTNPFKYRQKYFPWPCELT